MTSPLYAAITLGSNSFNMLVARTVNGQPCIIAKFKRKVRLAEGVGDKDHLSHEAMMRGIDCLAMFASEIEKAAIASEHVMVIATATLRRIANAQEFRRQALRVLPYPIDIISGEEEAELIYQGMVATTQGDERRLVIDIGGASTEFIIGESHHLLLKTSLPIGCVTFNQQFFTHLPFTKSDFFKVKNQVEAVLKEVRQPLLDLGWRSTLGASGSVQAVMELLASRTQPQVITHDVLTLLQQDIIQLGHENVISIIGLKMERAPTFVSGVAILLALFELLDIKALTLSGGALREGVLEQLAAKVG
ncbi:Ppx/GppA phosphatase family protein [Shewanella surugensis]|uniref:Exopolyphosphatase n=1 Tax=Shewanella surugensis TaxID=212020 RepID=A0ABT0LF25_9GAMM|nr:exopolyphosphatase [Shewanella surugensis]MCL1126317.1 exopolyphosphatase [Shewanella surugensis]